MDGAGHLLSLKVMRVSRPALASAWMPFYSNSPSFSAHSTASVLSLQGGTPLPGHPKTLRDLTNASTLLTLPSSFGAIQLGETFSGALAVNNESAAMVDGVSLRIEMQTATSKVLLAEIGGPTLSLVAGDTLEATVHHEIKELGQHVLACIVSYQLPPGARRPATSATTSGGTDVDTGDDSSGLQTFRKFYKFAVTNPLSVKTKVHVPRSPSALLSAEERTKVFLEVHIQNLTSEPMWFERMIFEPVPGWHVQDTNLHPDGQESLFSGTMAMIQPQDMRQYVYILNETNPSNIPVQHAPGTILPLGRLDISWRSSFGEPGRLLTSMLTRRIPLPQSQALVRPPQQQPHQPASALPLHLQRSASVAGHSSQPPSRSSTPPIGPAPYRPSSPFRNRPSSVPPRPHSPVTSAGSALVDVDPIDVDLVVRAIPRSELHANKPFSVAFTLGVSASVRDGQRRTLTLAVQHVQPPTRPTYGKMAPPAPSHTTSTRGAAATNSRLASAVATALASSIAPRSPSSTLLDGPLVGSPRMTQLGEHEEDHHDRPLSAASLHRIPPPEPMSGDETRYEKLRGATRFLGVSTVLVPPMTLARTAASADASRSSSPGGGGGDDAPPRKGEQFWDFELEYTPLKTGFVLVGGLRVLLLEDQVHSTEDAYLTERRIVTPVVLKEWDVIGEIWVKS